MSTGGGNRAVYQVVAVAKPALARSGGIGQGASMKKRNRSQRMSSTELALALVLFALMVAVFAVGMQLRRTIL
jgi:hypothetical protein